MLQLSKTLKRVRSQKFKLKHVEKSNPNKWKVANKESAHEIYKNERKKNHNSQSNKIRTEHKLLRNSTQSELNNPKFCFRNRGIQTNSEKTQ